MDNLCNTPEKCIEEIHEDNKEWMAKLEFFSYEADFIRNDLLGSHAFEPYTKNLFDGQAHLYEKMKYIKGKSLELIDQLRIHDNKMAGALECNEATCNDLFQGNHYEFREQLQVLETHLREAKKKLQEYTSEVLRYKKK